MFTSIVLALAMFPAYLFLILSITENEFISIKIYFKVRHFVIF